MRYLQISLAGPLSCLVEFSLSLLSLERLHLKLASDASTARFSNHPEQMIQLAEGTGSKDKMAGATFFRYQHRLVDIRLPHDYALRRNIRLPASIMNTPRHAVELAMRGLYHDSANDLYFDFRPRASHVGDEQVEIELLIVHNEPIQSWIAQLRRGGYYVRSVMAEDGWKGNNLLPPDERAQPSWRSIAPSIPRLALLLLALIAAWHFPSWKYRSEMARYDSRAAALSDDARISEELALELRRRIDAFQGMIEQRQSARPLVDILLEITNLHSDGSWARSLRVEEDEIVIQGEARDVAYLLERLEKSPMFKDAELLGPVFQIKGSFYETYHIRMRLAGSTSP